MKEKTCLALFSGGLDSLLSVKVMQEQGIKVIALNFDIGFYFSAYEGEGEDKKYKSPVPEDFDVRVVDMSEEFYEMIKAGVIGHVTEVHGWSQNHEDEPYKDESYKDYLKKSVISYFRTYPRMAGIGITAGENMKDLNNKHLSAPIIEQWLWDTYGEAVMQIKKEDPDRNIRFVHRHWLSDWDEIGRRFGQLPDGFEREKSQWTWQHGGIFEMMTFSFNVGAIRIMYGSIF